MNKISPDLLEVLERHDRARADVLARGDQQALTLIDGPIDVCIFFEGAADALVAEGFAIEGYISNFAQGGLSPEDIRRLALVDRVLSIQLPTHLSATLDRSVPDILGKDAWSEGVPPDTEARGKGEGVIIGVVDSGFDVFHGAFRNLNGTSRILRLWDQTFSYNAAGVPIDSKNNPITGDLLPTDETGAVLKRERAPVDVSFTYGGQFDTTQINTALNAHPDGKDLPISLRDQPVTGTYHGTHVAGIAAGNGAQNDGCTSAFTYIGVAPKADLVLVKTSVGDNPPDRIQNLVDAAVYIFRVAARQNPPNGKPCVINFSLGGHFGPHNGQDPRSRAFDTLTTGPLALGRSIVIAAGNDRSDDLHAAFTLARNTKRTMRVNLAVKARRLTLFGSLNPTAVVTCVVRQPGPGPAQQSAELATNVLRDSTVPIGTTPHVAQITSYPTVPADPDGHFWVSVSNPNTDLPKGVWEFDFSAGNPADANIHLWISSHREKDARFLPFPGAVASAQDVNRDMEDKRPAEWIASTITSLGSTRSAITVAAYDAEATGGPLAYFSSQGPAPNNLSLGLYDRSVIGAYEKPDIAAPGMNIDAPRGEARKCCLECNCCVDRYVTEQGTSMAAPHIAGVIALMYARNPALTPDEIKTILRDTHRVPPALPPNWPPTADLWGAGKVDAKAAVHSLVPRVIADEEPAHAPLPEAGPRILPVPWPERLRAWSGILDPHPSWNLCAALVSQHFDEVKRLIDTNRRVAAVWQRHGGAALVRGIAFADYPPDPPIPAMLEAGEPRVLAARLLCVLLRFGGDALRSDILRHASLLQALPGASWDELDGMVGGRA